jgi:hypothetical protein
MAVYKVKVSGQTIKINAQLATTFNDKHKMQRHGKEGQILMGLKWADSESDTCEFFGTHVGVICDNCKASPIVGFRYKCKECANEYDLCEACFAQESSIKLPLSDCVEHAHKFLMCKQDSLFEGMAVSSANTKKEKSNGKQKPNESCGCGSGKKYKKCCHSSTVDTKQNNSK